MATYTFENMSQSDASAFTASDFLLFASGTVANLGVSDTPGTTTSTALGTTITNETITLTENGKSLTFSAAVLSAGTQTSPSHVIFGNNDIAVFGTSAAETFTVAGAAGHAVAAFGFNGADSIVGGLGNETINGGEGNDTIVGHSTTSDTDYLIGGNGADVIQGGNGNDHIYGNVAVGAAGSADGNDVITTGNANNYVNGNAGDDSITGGTGNDRLYGGNGNDTIVGGGGHDYIQGNKGNDVLSDTGSDTIHGGADNDTITVTGTGSSQLFGDTGNDTITSGTGNDTIWGGTGYDSLIATAGGHTKFVFASGDSDIGNITSATTAAGHDTVFDTITGFVHGSDTLALGFSVTAVNTASGTATTFANADDAYTYAKAILAGHGTDVAALQTIVGGSTDTLLFWDSTHSTGTIDSVLDLHGYTASSVVKGDFV